MNNTEATRVQSPDHVVIVGAGLAGLFCALKLAPRPVTVISAASLGEGASSVWAQGGIAAAVGEGDTPEAHAADTIAVGGGIVDETVARRLASEAAGRIDDLLRYGVPFDRDLEGKLAVGREAAHSARRIVHVQGDRAGKAIITALIDAVRKTPSIKVIEGYSAEELLVEDGMVAGLSLRSTVNAEPLTLSARAVVLATGGIGHLYAVTTNPPESYGGGLAIAARAGAVIADPEFVQFHPTAVMIGKDPAPLATEALRGEGATLINGEGERFMLKVDPLAELAPRDIVARGVFAEIAAGRGAFLDATKAVGAAFAKKFPTVYESCLAGGIDAATQPIPIAPAAHYHMGGIAVDARGRSSIVGLWAAGEVSSTGAHGANRLASNSLLEAVVYAARIADDIRTLRWNAPNPLAPVAKAHSAAIEKNLETKLRETMSAHVGVIRDAEGLARGIRIFGEIEASSQSPALRNMATTALLVATSAYVREESRGAHFRSDFPEANPALARRTMTTLSAARHVASDLVRMPSIAEVMGSLT
jgi:L-aspartate oxidase